MNRALDTKERERIARAGLEYRNYQEASDALGVSRDTIRRCLKEFGLYERRKAQYSEEEKRRMAEESFGYENLTEAAKAFGASAESIERWVEEYYPGQKAEKKARIEELEKRYPDLISRKSPKIMSSVAEIEIKRREEERGDLEGVEAVLEEYKKSKQYVEAVSLGGSVYDIKGQVAGEVSLTDKLNAQRELRSWKFFKKLRGQGERYSDS